MTINKYKELTTEIKSKMERFYTLRKIENLENDIKLKTENLQKFKLENSVLNNIKKNQNKAKNQYEEKFENKQQIKILIEKFQNLKEEYKYSKDLQKNSEANLKKLNLKILALEEKNKKIRDVIELKKKFENLKENVVESENSENFLQLEERIKFFEIQISSEEKNYKSEIIKQNTAMNKLTDDMAILNLDIKEKEQQIKINELKLKETQKIKNLTNNLIKNANEKNSTKIKNERANSANLKIAKHNEKKYMYITPINLRQNRSKPFEIEKKKFDAVNLNDFNTNSNPYQEYKIYTNYDKYNIRKNNDAFKIQHQHENSNLSMVSQIEKLSKILIYFSL
jgi:hypothetical protein